MLIIFLLVPLAAVVFLVVLIVSLSRRKGLPPGMVACPGCGSARPQAETECRECGCPMNPGPTPR